MSNNVEEEKDYTVLNITYDTLRVVPNQNQPKDHPYPDRLTDILAILFIFGIAFWFRFWIRSQFISNYGDGVFDLDFKLYNNDKLNLASYFGVSNDAKINSEGYGDYEFYYIDYVNAFVDGWNPYSGNRVAGDVLNGYVYGPFYIYFIAIGKAWFGFSTEDSIIYSNIVFDSLTYVMVYVLAKRVTGNIIAMVVAVLSSFSPVALFYANIRVLNAPQMNFLTLLFIYYFLKHKDTTSMFVLAMAGLSKQIPIFLLMPIGFFMVRRYGILKGISFFILFFIFAFILSIPWIVLTPTKYYTRLFLPGGGKEGISCPQGGEATNLVAGELDLNSCNKYFQTNNPADIQVSEFGVFLDSIINNHLLFFASLFLLAWVGFTAYDYMEKNPKLYLRFFAAYLTLAHATIARGVYKYYTTLLFPLIILAMVPGNTNNSMHFRLGKLLNHGWSTWIEPKYRIGKAKIEYWLLFGALSGSTIGVIWLVNSAISMFTKSKDWNVLWNVIFIPLAIYAIIRPCPNQNSETDYKSELNMDKQLSLLLIFLFPIIFLLNRIFNLYFANISSTRLHYYQAALILIFLMIFYTPVLIAKVTNSQYDLNIYNINLVQFLIDIIGLVVVFYIFNFMNIQLILIHRYYTASILLAYSVFLMSLLGSEVWSTYFSVPIKAVTRFLDIVYYKKYESNYV